MSIKVNIGGVLIGGGEPVKIQSMTNTDTKDVEATNNQIQRLHECGCEIVRLAVADSEAATAFGRIKAKSPIPVVADIHFDYRLAIMAIENGADKIRINPGNIGGADRVKMVADKARSFRVPIRIGVNMGSLDRDLPHTAEGMVESAKRHVKMLNDCDFNDIVLSLKASSVAVTVKAYRMAATEFAYPLHVGVTEAGTAYGGIIKSAAGIGALLLDDIGDTIRVSLTAPPEEEVRAAKELLSALDLRGGAKLISCPTCGRTKIDIIKIAAEVEKRLLNVNKNITVAVMGCVVNGPGEAAAADIGIAGGDGCAVIFKQGKILRKVSEDEIVDELFKEIEY